MYRTWIIVCRMYESDLQSAQSDRCDSYDRNAQQSHKVRSLLTSFIAERAHFRVTFIDGDTLEGYGLPRVLRPKNFVYNCPVEFCNRAFYSQPQLVQHLLSTHIG